MLAGVSQRLSIGEFARASGLSVSALRFYDSAGLLIPAAVDGRTGYRSYDRGQLAGAELVRDLRRLEMPLAEIPRFLAAHGPVRSKMLAEHVDGVRIRLAEVESIARAVNALIDEQETSMTTMTVDAAALGQAIDQVLPAASTDSERPVLHGVLIEARDGSLRLVATDSYRLAVRDLNSIAIDGPEVNFRAVVAATDLSHLRASIAARGPVAVELIDNALRVGLSTGHVDIEVMPLEFPGYEPLLSADPAAQAITVEREGISQALAGQDSDVVRFALTSGGLRVEGDPPIELAGVYGGKETVVGLNPKLARYAVDAAMGPEVTLEVSDPNRPVVFRSATDSSYICMIMPIRLE